MKIIRENDENDKNENNELTTLTSSSVSDNDFWTIKTETVSPSWSSISVDILSQTASQLDISMAETRPLEEDKKNYAHVRALLLFWFASAVIILAYIVYFVYLLIKKIK